MTPTPHAPTRPGRTRHALLAAVAAATLLVGAGCSATGGDDSAAPDDRIATGEPSDRGTGDGTDAEPRNRGTDGTEPGSDGGRSGGTGGTDGGGDDPDASAYAEAIAASFRADDDFPGTSAQADCGGEAVVAAIGLDRFREAGYTPEDVRTDDDVINDLGMTETEAGDLYDGLIGCDIDLYQQFIDESSDDRTVQACLEKELSEDDVRTIVIAAFRQEPLGRSNPIIARGQRCFDAAGD